MHVNTSPVSNSNKQRYNSSYSQYHEYVNAGLKDFTVSNSCINMVDVISYCFIKPTKITLKQIRLHLGDRSVAMLI